MRKMGAVEIVFIIIIIIIQRFVFGSGVGRTSVIRLDVTLYG